MRIANDMYHIHTYEEPIPPVICLGTPVWRQKLQNCYQDSLYMALVAVSRKQSAVSMFNSKVNMLNMKPTCVDHLFYVNMCYNGFT